MQNGLSHPLHLIKVGQNHVPSCCLVGESAPKTYKLWAEFESENVFLFIKKKTDLSIRYQRQPLGASLSIAVLVSYEIRVACFRRSRNYVSCHSISAGIPMHRMAKRESEFHSVAGKHTRVHIFFTRKTFTHAMIFVRHLKPWSRS